MKSFVILILICIAGLSLKAQTKLDSLLSIWQDSAQTHSNRVNAYNKYIWDGYLFSNLDSAKVLAEALRTYAQKHNYPKASVTGYTLQGIANYFQGNYTHALDFYNKSLAIQEEIGDKRGIAASLTNIGIIYNDQGKSFRALEFYEKALAIDEELGDKGGIANGLGHIGIIYTNQGNYSRALEYYKKSLAIREELGDKKGISHSLNNIGNIYNDQGNFSLALEYYQKSLAIDEELGDKGGIANGMNNIGIIYWHQGKTSRALEYYQKSMVIKEEIGDKKGIVNSLNSMGSLYQKQNNASLALEYCHKGLALAEEIGALDEQKAGCQCLYDSYKDLGKGNEALMYLEKLNVITDSLNAQETTKKLQQMEFAKVMLQDSITKADEARLVQEAHQAEVQKKNQTRNIAIGIGILILLISGGLYSRLHYVRRSKANLQVEKDRSENLLLNILPAEIAEELKQKGRADARDFEMVSILFTDFKGFTEASAKLSATELVHEINYCFEGFDAITEKYQIEKIKTIGDAYMAAGGLPISTVDSIKNTVLAALEMQDFISKRKIANDAAGLPAFEMRVGIHTGPVVAGIVGVKKFSYDIWGDTVNTAARMESKGEIAKVNISQSTYEQLKDEPNFIFESRGKIEAKGKGEIEMWFVSLKNT